MTKQSQKSIFQTLKNSRLFWLGLVIVCVATGLILIIRALTSNPLEDAYTHLPTPSTWTQTSIEKNTLPNCAFSDITCPSISLTYNVSNTNDLASDIRRIHDLLSSQGYSFSKACYRADNTCRVPGIKATNGKVLITVWVVNGSNPLKTYVELQKV